MKEETNDKETPSVTPQTTPPAIEQKPSWKKQVRGEWGDEYRLPD
jgi:hypothetical protein